jgi:L-ascorbate metabolism protein UlaG (beta-lactamase superfamily)
MLRLVRRWRRFLWALAALTVVTSLLLTNGWWAFGHRAFGERRARVEASPHWKGGHFFNALPLEDDVVGMLVGAWRASPNVSPTAPLPAVTPTATPPASGLRATWFGHSSTLVEIDGVRVLTDPMWSERASPFTWAGPRRWSPVITSLEQLKPIDVVVISHDHYDHLDAPTVAAMASWDTIFVVPLGLGAHLAYWGVPEAHIVELDWWEHTTVKGLEVTATPARHASGRWGVDTGTKLWAGWALTSTQHRVYYSGDTGYSPDFAAIGARLGPFDLAMVEVGQYGPAWPDWHLGPEQAVKAAQQVRAKVLLPVHWGLLALAYHGWTEPIERVLVAARAAGLTVVAPRPGEGVEPATPLPVTRWWPEVPWDDALRAPQVSTHLD